MRFSKWLDKVVKYVAWCIGGKSLEGFRHSKIVGFVVRKSE